MLSLQANCRRTISLDASSPLALRCILVTIPQRRCALPAVFLARLAISRLWWEATAPQWPASTTTSQPQRRGFDVRPATCECCSQRFSHLRCVLSYDGVGTLRNRRGGKQTPRWRLEVASLPTRRSIGVVRLRCHLLSVPSTGKRHVFDRTCRTMPEGQHQ